VPVRRWRLRAAIACLLAGTAALAAVAIVWSVRDEYRPSYDGRGRLDSALRSTMRQFANVMSAEPNSSWLYRHTESGSGGRMRAFLKGYGGRPILTVSEAPDGDQTAIQRFTIGCPSAPQRVILVWSWLDGAWRAHPGYVAAQTGAPGEYPGCN
jgi:hypothetical protein